ncbi:hypothetical protein [Aeromonas caviae]|uniref:hypothetical protein n=1 Tax=Aeromonas caviae TaxID=648 RepID=UPI00403F4844
MSQLHGNIQMLTSADLDKFVDIIAARVEARITANQKIKDIQKYTQEAVAKALADQNKPAQKPIAEEEDIFANYKIEG